jgi:alpha-tubulin suppressor-like RCC1 family protein
VTVSGITTATAISADVDGAQACALLANGQIKCWGDNTNGRLGDGTTTSSSIPVAVLGITNATEISVGAGHACARLSTNQVQCWGLNNFGQLGDGTTTDSLGPVTVGGLG